LERNRYRATGADKKALRMKAEPMIKSSVELRKAKSKSSSGKPIFPPIMTVLMIAVRRGELG